MLIMLCYVNYVNYNINYVIIMLIITLCYVNYVMLC